MGQYKPVSITSHQAMVLKANKILQTMAIKVE